MAECGAGCATDDTAGVTVQMPGAHATAGEREVRIPVEGGEIVGWMSGDGPPLLLLHGGPGLSEYLPSLAAELAPSFTVFRYQQRGLPPSVTDGTRTVEGHVADAIAVLDGLGWDRAWIAGHSWGGHLAMHVVVAHPERALALAPIGALWAVGDGGSEEFVATLRSRVPDELQAELAASEAAEDAPDADPIGEPESLKILWPYYWGNPAAAGPMPPMLSDRVGGREAWASIEEHFAKGTLEQGLRSLAVPSILIHGDLDPIPASAAQQTAVIIPGSELRGLPNVGHWPWLEQPGVVRALLEEFNRMAVAPPSG